MKNIPITYPLLLLIVLFAFSYTGKAQNSAYQIAVLKYNGGGDWYANLETSLPNLIEYSNRQTGTNIDPEQAIVEVGSGELFNYPFVHMTGHGNVVFSREDADNLRNYLLGGGFLHIDDNYGMDQFIRTEMKKVFPEKEFIELPYDHPIYHQAYDFPNGPPKIHEHDGKPARGFGIIHNGRLVCYYTYETDLGDGWEAPEVHNDSKQARDKALQMGTNLLHFAFMGNDDKE